MALTKIKLNEVDTKADPVLADGVLLSDSADGGRGKISTLTDLQTLIGGGGGGGGGAVDSVAGKTGDVTLDASDIAETAALKIMTADERTKLTGIAAGAEVNTVDSVAGKTGDVTLDADDVSTTASKLWMSDTQASKLSGIAENANNYTHPASHPQSMIEGLADALAAKATLASPALTGTPTAPTAAAGTNTTQIATTAFCESYVRKWTYSYAGVGGAISASGWTMHAFGASGTLTLPLASSVASGVQVAAIVVLGGAEVVLTRSGSDQFVTPTGLATTYTLRGNGSSIVLVRVTASAWACVGAPDSLINAAIAPLAPLASPALTGTPTAPTAAAGTNTTQLATTAFVQAAVAGALSLKGAPGGPTGDLLLTEGTPSGLTATKMNTTQIATDALTGDLLLTEGTPSGPTATGTKGMARFDADYFYVCTATNTWARFPKDGAWT